MKKGTARLMMTVGAIGYVALMVLQLMTQLFSVTFFSFASIGIAVQVALALPVLGYLFAGLSIPIVEYSKWLALVVAVLAVSGNLGVREPTRWSGPETDLRAEGQALAEDGGQLEILELKVDLAGAEDDDDKKDIEKKIKAVRDDLSDSDKKELGRKSAVLKAEQKVAEFKSPAQLKNIADATGHTALIIIAAMLVLAGAVFEGHEGSTNQKPEPASGD